MIQTIAASGEVKLPLPAPTALPPHGIPTDLSAYLLNLLDEARCLRDFAISPGGARRTVWRLERTVPMPLPGFSRGGLCDSLNVVLRGGGEVPI
jgi:hypothetical protein